MSPKSKPHPLLLLLAPLGWFLIAVATVLAAFIVIPGAPLLGPARLWPLAKAWCRMILALAGTKVRLEGNLEGLPDSLVIISNHASHLDGPALVVAFPRPISFVIKKELARIPFFGQGMLAFGLISVDRARTDKAKKQITTKGVKALSKGRWVVVFAEGTRSTDGKLQRFKKGGFHIAVQAGASILPVAIVGSHRLLPKGALVPRARGEVVIRVGKPISVDGKGAQDVPQLLARTRQEIAKLLGEV